MEQEVFPFKLIHSGLIRLGWFSVAKRRKRKELPRIMANNHKLSAALSQMKSSVLFLLSVLLPFPEPKPFLPSLELPCVSSLCSFTLTWKLSARINSRCEELSTLQGTGTAFELLLMLYCCLSCINDFGSDKKKRFFLDYHLVSCRAIVQKSHNLFSISWNKFDKFHEQMCIMPVHVLIA